MVESAYLFVSFVLVGVVYWRFVGIHTPDIVLLLCRVHNDNSEVVIGICVHKLRLAHRGCVDVVTLHWWAQQVVSLKSY